MSRKPELAAAGSIGNIREINPYRKSKCFTMDFFEELTT
jgi:hypothetical protein